MNLVRMNSDSLCWVSVLNLPRVAVKCNRLKRRLSAIATVGPLQTASFFYFKAIGTEWNRLDPPLSLSLRCLPLYWEKWSARRTQNKLYALTRCWVSSSSNSSASASCWLLFGCCPIFQDCSHASSRLFLSLSFMPTHLI